MTEAQLLNGDNQQIFEDKSLKPDYSLIPKEALDREAMHMTRGSQKLNRKPGDWKEEVIKNPSRYKKSLLRHCLQYVHDENDEDHLAAIRANTAILAWYENYQAERKAEFEELVDKR
jgi:spore coat polysaccharide biosynthesis protein SpsF (cytidylyltransferase family)